MPEQGGFCELKHPQEPVDHPVLIWHPNDMPGLTPTEREALTRFTQQVRQAFPDRVANLRLFGSKARGDARKFSDVDVLVVLDHPDRRDAQTVHAIANRVFLETDVDLSLKVLPAEAVRRMRAGGSPFIAAIDREGIAL